LFRTYQMMVFFSNLKSTCANEFYWFYAYDNINKIINIINIINFQFGFWSMMHLWWFWDIYTSILLWLMFCWFFWKVHQGFFPFNLCKKLHFLWHRTLNQHIHIDTMYPFGITHFNTMIFIPLCENCKLCTYWYHLV